MPQKFSNAARAELAAAIDTTATSFTIDAGGERFPVANTGAAPIGPAADWFKVVLQDDTSFEIVYVRSHASGSTSFTNVMRAQEGTTAAAFAAGTVVGLRPLASDADAAANKRVDKAGDTMTGPLNVPAGATGAQVPQAQEVPVLARGVLERRALDFNDAGGALDVWTENWIYSGEGGFSMSLPSTPAVGDRLELRNYDNSWGNVGDFTLVVPVGHVVYVGGQALTGPNTLVLDTSRVQCLALVLQAVEGATKVWSAY